MGLRPGYRVLDDDEQRLLLREKVDAVFGPDRDTLSGRGWHGGVQTVDEAARYIDRICDELIDPEDWPSRNAVHRRTGPAAVSATGASCCTSTPWTSPTSRCGPTG